MAKQFHINAFTQCSVCPQSKGQWKNPEDRSSLGYRDIEYWLEIARTLERGCIDSLFFADIHGVYDVYGGNMNAGVRHAVQFPGNDPTVLLPLLAHETRNLGFMVTMSTTYYPPFHTAKLFSSLDHFTGGRIGWNIVTSYLESAYKNGLGAEPLAHDDRYDQADEYMDVVYKLWERSWDDDAGIRDKVRDIHTDPARIHTIDHQGEHYSVRGPHMCEPSPQRTPLLVQAGQSPRGIRFGATHGEALFVLFPGLEAAKAQTPAIREAAVAAGRSPDALKLLMGISICVAETEKEAKAKFARYKSYASPEGALALFGGWTGIDLSKMSADDRIDAFESDGMQFIARWFSSVEQGRPWTFGEMRDHISIASLGEVITGSPEQVADRLEAYVDEGGVDGFNIIPIVQPRGHHDLVDFLIPELQRRGRFRTQYEGSTLRETFFGAGQKRLASGHPGLQTML